MKKLLIALLLIPALALSLSAVTMVDGKTFLLTLDTEEEINRLGDDGTKTTFALNTETVNQGAGACDVIPSGEGDETKVAFIITKKDAKAWSKAKTFKFDVYLPKKNKMNPMEFFLGIGDVSGKDFKWIDGVFAPKTMKLNPGWNTIPFELLPKMVKVKSGKKYQVIIVFIGRDEGYVKTPLKEMFIIDGLSVEK